MTTNIPEQIQIAETFLSEEKGIKAPRIHISITTRGWMMWGNPADSYRDNLISTSMRPTAEAMLADFWERAHALPDPETAKRNEYLATLDKASELAKDLGYNTNFITNEMLRLSENALEHRA